MHQLAITQAWDNGATVLASGSVTTFPTPLCGTRDHPLGKRWRPAYEGGPSARGCDWLTIVRDHPLGKTVAPGWYAITHWENGGTTPGTREAIPVPGGQGQRFHGNLLGMVCISWQD